MIETPKDRSIDGAEREVSLVVLEERKERKKK